MNSYLHRYIQRDKFMERDKKQVEQARDKMVKQGNNPLQALKKIKKAFWGAIKGKLN